MRATARLATLLLAAAIGLAPLAFDGCLMQCQAPAVPTTHSCHQGGADHSHSKHQLRSDTRPCNHEHGEKASLAAAGDIARFVPTFHAVFATTLGDTSTAGQLWFGPSEDGPPLHRAARSSLSLPLRI